MNLTLLIAALALCGFGWAVISYAGYAMPRGLLAGSLYAADFSWLQGFAYLAMFASVVFGFLGFWLLGGGVLSSF